MNPRPFRGLVLKGFLFLALGLLLWVIIQPAYSRILITVSQTALSWIGDKEKTSIRLENSMIIYVPMGLAEKGGKAIPAGKREIRDLHYNSVILFALVLFSPGLRLRKRMGALMGGLLLLFATQVMTVLMQVKFFYAYQLGDYSRMAYGPWERNLYTFLKQFFELVGRFAFPFAIWMLFTYKETIGYLTGTEPGRMLHQKRRK